MKIRNQLTILSTLLFGFAGSSFAGGLVEVEPTAAPAPRPVAPTIVDWSGPYVGLSYSSSSGDLDFIPAPPQALDDGQGAGIFAGYLWQNGNLVFGGEISHIRLDDAFVTGFTCCDVSYSTDLKGRIGYAMNRLMVYGVLGYSWSDYNEPGTGQWDPKGTAVGVGADYRISQRFSLGLEYLARDLEGDNPTGAAQQVQIDLNTLSLRAAFHF